MRKAVVFTILTVLVSLSPLFANYRVLHVRGALFNETKSKPVELGDIITPQEVITVKSEGAACYLFSSADKQRLALNLSPGNGGGRVSEIFLPLPERKAITSRGDEDEKVIKLADYFGIANYVFLDSTETITLHENYFDLSGSTAIISQTKKDGETIKAQLELQKDKLVISVPEMLQGKNWDNFRVELYGVNTATGEFKKLVAFDAMYLDIEKIRQEIGVLKASLGPAVTTEELNKEISLFIMDVYGAHNHKVLYNKLARLN